MYEEYIEESEDQRKNKKHFFERKLSHVEKLHALAEKKCREDEKVFNHHNPKYELNFKKKMVSVKGNKRENTQQKKSKRVNG